MTTLIERLSDIEYLYYAFKVCRKNKRQAPGYKRMLGNTGMALIDISEELKKTRNYKWSKYIQFYVHDPKTRLIMSAPFKDRILHTAITLLLEPYLDPLLSSHTFACRKNKGTRNAVLEVSTFLKIVGQNRYALKLDVAKYFSNIDHQILLDMIMHSLNQSLAPEKNDIYPLLESLLESETSLKNLKKGLPLGNLTSQLFANFYLKDIDKLACDFLNIDYHAASLFQSYPSLKEEDRKKIESFYIRYMDDMLLIHPCKEKVARCAKMMEEYARDSLKLEFPYKKKIHLKQDKIPFLGFLLDQNFCYPLSRARRRFIRRFNHTKHPIKKILMYHSFHAWTSIYDEIL